MSSADYICKQFGSSSGPTKCRLLIKSAVLTKIRTDKMSSADYICKQFGSSSGPTKRRLLITFAKSFDPDQSRQNAIC